MWNWILEIRLRRWRAGPVPTKMRTKRPSGGIVTSREEELPLPRRRTIAAWWISLPVPLHSPSCRSKVIYSVTKISLKCRNWIITYWAGGFHGRTIGVLSTTHSKAIHKIDIPALDWPIASFPRYKYPLEEHVEENKAEDRKCLAEVEEQFERFNKVGKFVAGVVIEPIQAEGGDNHASPEFFQELQRITKKVCTYY